MNCASYPSGQCTWYCCENWSQQVGPYWGDGKMWLASAQKDGWLTSPIPEIGDIAVWGANTGGTRDAGHVALVISVNPLTVAESNWNVPLQPDHRVVSDYSKSGIIGYVRPTKTTEEVMTYTPEQQRVKIHETYWEFLMREVENNDAMTYHLGVWNVKGMEACLAEIWDGPEAAKVMAAKRAHLGL
jgi:surface antigen